MAKTTVTQGGTSTEPSQFRSIPWWRRLPLPWFRWKILLFVEAADEIPAHLPAKAAVLAGGTPDQPSWIAFDCPCRRGHRVMLNLDRKRRPVWTVRQVSPLTLSPSINDFTIDTKCHYFIRQGRVEWVPYNN